MKALKTSVIATTTAAWVFAFATPDAAFSEQKARHNASALLDETKLIDYEQRVATKKLEMDRLNEDLKKGADEVESINKRIQKVGGAVDDATRQLEQLTAQKKRATLDLELLNLRIDAERLKGEGLKLLQNANRKAQDAVAKRNEEINARTALVAAETRQLASKAPNAAVESGPATPASKHGAKNEPTIAEWRKKLEKAERATATAESQAREALLAATAKLRDAENATAKAEKKQEEVAQDKTPAPKAGN
jgi:chromosome segregation ATPase